MLRAREIPRAKNEYLLILAKQRLGKYPLLFSIYTDKFLVKLVQKKYDLDNELLQYLVLQEPIIDEIFQEIEENLDLLQPEFSLQKYANKLKQYNSINFQSVIAELDIISTFKRNGYQILIEPTLPNSRVGDFLATKNNLSIYFEVKGVVTERILKEGAISFELETRVSGMDEPYEISIELTEAIERMHVVNLSKFILNKLKNLDISTINIPYSFEYDENGKILAIITVDAKLSDGEKGYISVFYYPTTIKNDWSDLRKKISKKIRQLHPDYPGVIVLQPYSINIMLDDMENAILGDLRVNFRDPFFVFRAGDCIIGTDKNHRLSAIMCYQRKIDGGKIHKKITIYHHYYANHKLSSNIYMDNNVIHWIPKRESGGLKYEK
jgi:hypothetical protein